MKLLIYSVDEEVKKYELYEEESNLAYSFIIQCFDKGEYNYIWHTESAKDA